MIPSEQDHDARGLYLSLRDPIGFIDDLIRLRYEVQQGATPAQPGFRNNLADIHVASEGVSATQLDEQFSALPAEIRLQLESGPVPTHGPHVLRWVNSETADVEHMSRMHLPGGDEEPLRIDTGPLGGATGAWHLELYQARDGLPRVARIPVTVGNRHQATRRSDP